MTYDLKRLRLADLIHRPRSNPYVLTADGMGIAVFYTEVYNRLLLALTATDQPSTCRPARRTGHHQPPRRREV